MNIKQQNINIDYDTRRSLYRKGKYTFRLAVPVPTGAWNEDSWIRYIDSTGRWLIDNTLYKRLRDSTNSKPYEPVGAYRPE